MSSRCRHFVKLAAIGIGLPMAASGVVGPQPMKSTANTVDAKLNGLAITLDSDTGGILRIGYAGVKMLEAETARSSVLDLAYPIKEFEPLRLASRFSHGAKIAVARNRVTIHWDRLGTSRDWTRVEGAVAATVTMEGAPDGRSIVLSCSIENNSKNAVRQVLFPDFDGLLPFAGLKDTTFRCSAFGMAPFVELAPSEEKRAWHYVQPKAAYSVEYTSGGFHLSDMVVRWMNFGGLNAGFSLFPKRWGWDPEVPVMLQLSEVERKLRMMWLHPATIGSGEKWESGEFWLTPHVGGWAKGIEPYRAWAREHFKREFPVPKHVREGLGFRTLWMSQYQPNDPQDPVFRFRDFPKLAEESKLHGLDELVFWCWHDDLVRPMGAPYPGLGSEREMAGAVAACRRIGVNAAPFVGILSVGAESAARYGLQVTDGGSYTYHSELIPRTGTGYATQFAAVQPGTTNPKWHEDILAGLNHLADIGVPSVSFDQFLSVNAPPPNMTSLSALVRAYAIKRDTESTLSGEELRNWEIDCNTLDYTWNWGPYKDWRPLTSVYPAPRLNFCIDSSPLNVKKAFADNLYMCVMPRKPESTNGSDWIVNHPSLSRALMQCKALRKRFLRYFTEGTLIGECLLSAASPAHVSSYVLPDRILTIVVNDGPARSLSLSCSLSLWLKSASGRYEVATFGEDGRPVGTVELVGSSWKRDVGRLATGQMRLFEFTRH